MPRSTDDTVFGQLDFVGCCSFRVVADQGERCYEVRTGEQCDRCRNRLAVLAAASHTRIVRRSPQASA